MNNKDNPTTINMLLDITNFFGESDKKLKPILIFLACMAPPPLLYINFLFFLLPFVPCLIVYILYGIRLGFYILGKEKKRVAVFKKMLYDVYSTSAELMNVKEIHEDGVVEYNNGLIAMGIMTENGTDLNMYMKASVVNNILDKLTRPGLILDVYTHNITAIEELSDRYDSINTIKSTEVAEDYIKTIDNYIERASKESLVTRTYFVLKSQKNYVEEMARAIGEATASPNAKVFKIFRKITKEDWESTMSRDIGTYVNFDKLRMDRFQTDTSREMVVLDYNVKNRVENLETLSFSKEKEVNVMGFIQKEGNK